MSEKEIKLKIKGIKGDTGSQGIQGERGIQGEPGKDGRDGKDGSNGKDGKIGKTGPKGDPGVDGKDGIDGKTIIVKETLKEIEIEYETIKNTPNIPAIVRTITKDIASQDVYWSDLKGDIPTTITPAGSTPDVQINNGGVFGAIPSNTGSIAKVLTQVDGETPTWEYPEVTTNLTFMFTNVASDISTYLVAKDLPNYVIDTIQTITTVGVSTTPTLLATFATETGYPNKTVIPVGVFHFHFDTEKNAGGNNYYCYCEIYKRDTGGTETLLATSDITTQTASNAVVQQNMTAINTTSDVIDATDRIVVKVYAVMLSSTATIKLYIDDNTDARFEMPSTSLAVPDLQEVTDMGATTTNTITSQSFITTGGTEAEYVLGNGQLRPIQQFTYFV